VVYGAITGSAGGFPSLDRPAGPLSEANLQRNQVKRLDVDNVGAICEKLW